MTVGIVEGKKASRSVRRGLRQATSSAEEASKLCLSEVLIMLKSTSIATNVATAAGILFVGFLGYVLLSALPDLRRYIRISTM
jgi:hypothetical protein